MDNVVELFCFVDDFCQDFMPKMESTFIGDRVEAAP